MDDARAHERLKGVLELIDSWGLVYEHRWGLRHPNFLENPALEREVDEGIDEVRTRTKFAQGVIALMGEKELAAKVVESVDSYAHPLPKRASRLSMPLPSWKTGRS